MNLKSKVFTKIITLILLAIVTQKLQAQKSIVADKIIAIVGSKYVLLSEMEVLYLQTKRENPSINESYQCELLQQKIFEKMLISQGQRDSIVISDAEVESNLDRRIRYYTQLLGSKEKFEAYYKKSTEEIKDQFREEIKDQLLAQQVQNSMVQATKISPSDVRKFFNNIPKDSLPVFPAYAELQEIVRIPKPSKLQDSLALSKIRKIREDIISGADFASKAVLYSQDPGSAKNGGEYKGVERGAFVPEFEGVALSQKEGEVSEPIKTDFGYHIIKTIKNYGNTYDVRHILIKPEISTDDAINIINQLDSLKKAIDNGSISFEKAVQLYSDENQSKSMNGLMIDPNSGASNFELNSMDADMRMQVEKLNIGQVSEALVYNQATGEQAFRIVKLLKKVDAHTANINDDYERIKQVALTNKQQIGLEQWVDEVKGKYYIWIDDEYKNCEVLQRFVK